MRGLRRVECEVQLQHVHARFAEHAELAALRVRGDELRDRVKTIRKDLFGLRFQNATGELENTAGLGTSKRDLARALTVARERGIDVES